MNEKKIYVIVAETVQSPTVRDVAKDGPTRDLLLPTTETKTILQPKGRIAAQCAHVVSQVRDMYGNGAFPIIILSVPDSYQLQFRFFLLCQTEARVYGFVDTNDEYGPDGVRTVICTGPIYRREAGFALDYLPLWS